MKKISQEEQYKTLLVIITGLLVIGLISKKLYWNIADVIIGLIGVIIPVGRYYIVWAWIKLGEVMGKISSTIILTLVFFCILWPVSIAYKLTGKDPLLLKKQQGTLFSDRNHLFIPADLKNLW